MVAEFVDPQITPLLIIIPSNSNKGLSKVLNFSILQCKKILENLKNVEITENLFIDGYNSESKAA